MQAEKLNLWDRIFNRYRKVILESGTENWHTYNRYTGMQTRTFSRDFTRYKVIDRVTGSESIKVEYHN